MTTNLTKINLGAMAFACLALTSARAVPIDLKVDPNSSPGTTPYVLGNVNPTTDRSESFVGSLPTIGTIADDDMNIPEYGFGRRDDQYGQSDWRPSHPKTNGEVPDGGSTASLLGFGLLGLGFVHRCLSQRKRSEARNAA